MTEQQAAELASQGETTATIRRAPWYYALIEASWKYMLALVGVMGLFIGNSWIEGQRSNTEATGKLADVMGSVQQELVRQGTQLAGMTEAMRQLSSRQDAAIATAERAMAEQQGLRSRVELLQYYVLELDAKLIAAGIKPAKEAVSTRLADGQQKDAKQ